jgi:DNA polymerase-3 subunit beta
MTKITIDRELLLEKLNKVYKFVPAKSIIPALDNILFDVKDNKMSITAFNGEVQCKLSCTVKCKEDISFCLPAKLFVSIVRLFRENELVVTVTETKTELKCGKSKYNLAINCKPIDFPDMKFNNETPNSMTMLQTVFNDYASRASSFCSKDEVRPSLTGMLVSFKDKELLFYGCTGAYMCKATVPVISVDKWDDVIIPANAVKKVCDILGTGEVNILHSDNIIMFSSTDKNGNDFDIISTCVNEKFPKVDQFFAIETEHSVIINTSEVADALGRIKLCADPLVFATKLSLKNSDLELSCSDANFGNDGQEILSITNTQKAEKVVAFNIDLLLKILESIDDVETTMFWTNSGTANTPFVFKGNNEFATFQFVLCQTMLEN